MKYVGLSINLNSAVTAELVADAFEQFKKTQSFVDDRDLFWQHNAGDKIIIAMSDRAGYLCGSLLRDHSQYQYFLTGFLKCYFSVKGVGARDINIGHIVNLIVNDNVYTNCKTQKTMTMRQLCEA